MNYKEFNVSLPVDVNNVVIIDGIVQYDTANIINLRLMEGVEAFDFTGYTEVFIEILKPDGTHIQSCVTDDPKINKDNNPYTIQVVDPAQGRVSFNLQGQATILTGTHFAQIMIASGGKIITSARVNYYVGDTLQSDVDPDSITSSEDYTTLRTLIARNSAIATEERTRVDAETVRKLAELAREGRFSDLEQEVRDYHAKADGYVDQTRDYMQQAQNFAQLAQNPSAEIMQALITDLDLASESYVTTSIAAAVKNFDAGSYTDDAATKKLLKVKRGLNEDMPILDAGELGFSTDTKIAYIGSSSGNIPLNGKYEAGTTAPERTDILWIDTGAGGVIKYYNGSAWTPTATAALA